MVKSLFQAKPAPAPTKIIEENQSLIKPLPNSPLAKRAFVNGDVAVNSVLNHSTSISKSDVDALGAELPTKVGTMTDSITSKFTAAKFGDMGQILVKVQCQADRLDPKSMFKGVGGWFKEKFVDIKAYVTAELETATTVFDQLIVEIHADVSRHEQWVKDLDVIYQENYEMFTALLKLRTKALDWKTILQKQIATLPVIDTTAPDALLRAQERSEYDGLITRLEKKADSFARLMALCENNSIELKNKQSESMSIIDSLNDLANLAIPMIRREFANYKHTLDTQGSLKLFNNTMQLADKSLRKGADDAKIAALETANASNSAVVSTDTMNYLRNRIIETVQGVNQINDTAKSKREADAIQLQLKQQELLTVITQ